MTVQHFVSISGGKDSQLTAIRAIKWFETRGHRYGNTPPRFVAADTDHEEAGWHEFIRYMEQAMGITIEVVKADFTEAMRHRRENLAREWGTAKVIRDHTTACKGRREAISSMVPRSAERAEAQRNLMAACREECPVRILPAVDEAQVAWAIELLHPTGNSYLDLCMLKGRFPSTKRKFCTEELKLAPMMLLKQPVIDAGISIVEWIGERAEESPGRARKPTMQRIRNVAPKGSQVLYRPILHVKEQQVFDEIAAAGFRWNPLYDRGAKRVGCWPCINCGKDEIRLLDDKRIALLREWEKRVTAVSRRTKSTFYPANMLPGPFTPEEHGRSHIDAVVEWARTSHGGRQFDLILEIERLEAEELGGYLCDDQGVCG